MYAVHICMCICHVCMYVCVYVRYDEPSAASRSTSTYIHTCMHACISVLARGTPVHQKRVIQHTYIYVYIHICIHTYMYTYICIHACMHAYIHTYICLQSSARCRVLDCCTYIHTHTHTHTHTYTHAHTFQLGADPWIKSNESDTALNFAEVNT